MSRLVVCGPARRIIPEVIDALNGDGPAPGAVTIGGTEVYFEPPTLRSMRHEGMHVTQAARFAPWWLRWLPLRARAWAGFPRFAEAYVAEHERVGYEFNRFELEARAAEGFGSEEKTPQPPQV